MINLVSLHETFLLEWQYELDVALTLRAYSTLAEWIVQRVN